MVCLQSIITISFFTAVAGFLTKSGKDFRTTGWTENGQELVSYTQWYSHLTLLPASEYRCLFFRFLKTYINYIEKNNFLHYRMWDDIVHGHENQLTVGCVVDAMRAGE